MENLIESVSTSLIDSGLKSSEKYQIDLITNKNIKTITYLEENLRTCSEFLISVAFITKSGVALLKPILKELELKGITGKIVSGDYLGFTEPSALQELDGFKNIEVRLSFSSNLHTKGYFFKQDSNWNVIVGSSNLTQTALTSNNEWNLKVSTNLNGKLCSDIIREFHNLFSSADKLDQVLEQYKEFYEKKHNHFDQFSPKTSKELVPNEMQQEALEQLSKSRVIGKNKALIISATGTGKTYLAAFDVQKVSPKRMLFIVHRENIAQKAMQSFRDVMPNKSYGLYTGNSKQLEADYIFATSQTLTKDRHLYQFANDCFDYVIFDEVHHLGANTQTKIFDYFKPKFTLGLTATPERNDDRNIFEMFDYNLVYEIRLHDALEAKFLVPFHYYGIADTIDANSKSPSFDQLSDLSRIENIIEKARFYGHCGEKLHGLIFASSIKEAKFIEVEFQKRGIAAKALTGSDNEFVRDDTIKQLENGIIDYIITVDIFNEGIDIRCINQVIFLRQTESSIIFIQQLGRGLRLNTDKEYLTVLDFIGNYKTDFLIPTALSQNFNYDKEDMLKFILSPSEIMPGETTIHFEEIAKERIFKNIRQTNFSNQTKLIQNDYVILKKRLGKKPLLNNFYEHRLISPNLILNKFDTILDVYKKYDATEAYDIDEVNYNHLKFICTKLSPARRPHEFLILKYLIENNSATFIDLVEYIKNYIGKTNHIFNEEDIVKNAIGHLMIQSYQNSYKDTIPLLVQQNNKFFLNFDSNYLFDDIVNYNLNYFNDNYKVGYPHSIYEHYTKRDISKHFLFPTYEGGNNVQGYKTDHERGITLAFITLSSESDADTHDDQIISRSIVKWHSQKSKYISKNKKLTTEGKILNKEIDLYLFVQKTKKDPFYSFGKIKNLTGEEIIYNGINKVEFYLELEKEIPIDLFNYLYN